jgi:hypothetical protein
VVETAQAKLFCKFPLSSKLTLLLSASRFPAGLQQQRKSDDAAAEKSLKKLKISVDRSKPMAKVNVPPQ